MLLENCAQKDQALRIGGFRITNIHFIAIIFNRNESKLVSFTTSTPTFTPHQPKMSIPEVAPPHARQRP
jgi:hypothetical protein